MDALWNFVQSPLGIFLAVCVILVVRMVLVKKYPSVAEYTRKYVGYAIEAIKWAEKLGLLEGRQKAQAALGYFTRLVDAAGKPVEQYQVDDVVAQVKGMVPDDTEERLAKLGINGDLLKQMLNVVHAKLEAAGNL